MHRITLNPPSSPPAPTASGLQKRPSPFSDQLSRPRKRNTTACRVCRARKTKCDNKKPRCSYCESTGSACDSSTTKDAIPLPAGDRAILDRIDRLEKTLLRAYQVTGPEVPADIHANEHSPSGSKAMVSTSSKKVCHFTIERVLAWPVFQDEYRSCLNLRDLMTRFGASSPDYRSPSFPMKSGTTISVELESCPRLLDSFFSRIHIKNPILDEQEVRSWTREVSLNGVGWDARSCLVLLVCALGAISTPFLSDHTCRDEGSFRESDDYMLAEAWFAASQKRIGMLLGRGGSILEAQCFFFSGVYLMHCFKPYSAWQFFLQALACCQTFQCLSPVNEAPFPADAFTDSGAGWRSEESVYWTCFKSELELRLELSLPAFNAMDLSYPDFLPSPPIDSIKEQDQAWYFYLAEIALRRLANQILNVVLPYENGLTTDLKNIATSVREFEIQAQEWSQLLPPEIDIRNSAKDEDVLRFILRGHLMNCYEITYWPFTTTAINHPESRDRSYDSCVKKGFQICVDRIRANESGFQHRHHGTFFMLRSVTRSALVLVAGKKCGHLDDLLPRDWYESVREVIALLDFWREESGDAGSRRDILEHLLRNLEVGSISTRAHMTDFPPQT